MGFSVIILNPCKLEFYNTDRCSELTGLMQEAQHSDYTRFVVFVHHCDSPVRRPGKDLNLCAEFNQFLMLEGRMASL